MILFVGFVLAVVFVALALVLNSVIFTENLATRSESTRASHSIAIANDVEVGVVAVVEYANEHNTSDDAAVKAEIRDGTSNIERLISQQQLTDGAVANVTFLSYSNATWINQSYEVANFTDAEGTKTWTLVSDQRATRKFRIHIINTSNFGTTSDGNSNNFTVNASGSGGTPKWEMEVYEDSGTPTMKIVDGNGNTRFCNPDAGEFWINVSDGSVEGDNCRFRFGENVSDVQSIRYEHGDKANGTYRLLVDNQTSLDSSKYNSTGEQPPILTPAAWNATVHFQYETRTLTYETTIYARPGENDD
jgi:hypothetical protein